MTRTTTIEIDGQLRAVDERLQRALDAGERFLYVSRHPLANDFRQSIAVLCQMICADNATQEDFGLTYGGTSGSAPPLLFIGGCHKSGTTLLRNLLDGHPRLIVVPSDGFGIRFARKVAKMPKKDHLPVLVQGALSCVSMPIAGERPFWILGPSSEPYLRLGQCIRGRLGNRRDLKTILDALLLGIADTLTSGEGTNYVVEKSTFNVEDAQTLAKLYPDAKFLQIVRHPGAVIAAQKRKQKLKSRSFCLRRECEVIGRSFQAGNVNQSILGPERWHCVKYEDLVDDTSSVMSSLADWLQIGFDQILCRPTVFGQPAGSNTSRSLEKPRDGAMSRSAANHWQAELSGDESALINTLFACYLPEYGYKSPPADFSSMVKSMTHYAKSRGTVRQLSELVSWMSVWLKFGSSMSRRANTESGSNRASHLL